MSGNMHGFSTNQIESRWSVLKRWIRKRSGGKLPGKDRQGWKRVLAEFQWRKYIQYNHNIASNNYRFVPPMFFRMLAAL